MGVDLELEERKGHFEKNGWYVVHFSIFLHIIPSNKRGCEVSWFSPVSSKLYNIVFTEN